MVSVAFAAVGLFVLRRRDSAQPRFRAPGYPWSPAFFTGAGAVVITLIALAGPFPLWQASLRRSRACRPTGSSRRAGEAGHDMDQDDRILGVGGKAARGH